MAEVTTLSYGLIRKAVVKLGIKPSIYGDGSISFSSTNEIGGSLHFVAMMHEETKDVLNLQCLAPRFVESAKLTEMLVFCNRWNRQNQMPFAYVDLQAPDGSFSINLDYNLLGKAGVHLELISVTLVEFIAGSIRFWKEADRNF